MSWSEEVSGDCGPILSSQLDSEKYEFNWFSLNQ